MSKKKTQTVEQEKATQVKQDAAPVKKTANESKKEEKVATATEEKTEKEAVKQHRPPQMVTVNGDKVSHAHAFQSNKNSDDWFFTAKLNGVQLRPQYMSAEDVKAWQDRSLKVEDAMQHYYPTKLMPKVTPEQFAVYKKNEAGEYQLDQAGNKIPNQELPDGRKVDKFSVYKEQNEQSQEYGKYKMHVEVGNRKLTKLMSHEDLNAYFDRVTTPAKLTVKNFGEQLNLAAAYAKYQIPQEAGVEKVLISKNKDGKYEISASGSFGRTEKKVLSAQDTYSFFHVKTATREQLAAKYFQDGFKAAPEHKVAKSRSMGIK